jgi:hypothetical protein
MGSCEMRRRMQRRMQREIQENASSPPKGDDGQIVGFQAGTLAVDPANRRNPMMVTSP